MSRPRRVLWRRTAARAAVAGGVKPDDPRAPEDPFEQVKQLGELREEGILTQEEFTAEKRRVLGL
jgi:putative oligomerization/nucleic acid binding protein